VPSEHQPTHAGEHSRTPPKQEAGERGKLAPNGRDLVAALIAAFPMAYIAYLTGPIAVQHISALIEHHPFRTPGINASDASILIALGEALLVDICYVICAHVLRSAESNKIPRLPGGVEAPPIFGTFELIVFVILITGFARPALHLASQQWVFRLSALLEFPQVIKSLSALRKGFRHGSGRHVSHRKIARTSI
jgi:hypothetical protein